MMLAPANSLSLTLGATDAKGKAQVQAQSDEMALTSLKDLTITSVQDDIDHDGANVLWQEYLVSNRSKLPYSLKAALKDNLGVVNMLACEPPKSANKDSYVKIARQLAKENDEADAKYIETSLAEAPPDNDPIPISMIVLDKAPLYELPDETYETRMYLVKGDQVILLDTMKPNWVLIKYIEKKGEAILKWVKADTVKLPE